MRNRRRTYLRKYSVEEIFKFIVMYKRQHDGCSPALDDIMKAIGISSTSVCKDYLGLLVEMKKIVTDNVPRSIEVVGGYQNVKMEEDYAKPS